MLQVRPTLGLLVVGSSVTVQPAWLRASAAVTTCCLEGSASAEGINIVDIARASALVPASFSDCLLGFICTVNGGAVSSYFCLMFPLAPDANLFVFALQNSFNGRVAWLVMVV